MARSRILYNFIIGRPLSVPNNYFVPSTLKQKKIILEEFYDDKDPNAYLFDNHQIVFSGTKSSTKKEDNKCHVTLFNLDDDTVNYLEANAGNNLVAILRAGDNETGLLDIFKGTVKRVEDSFPDQDRRTKIILTDGGFNTTNARTVRSYQRGTPKKKIIEDLVEDLRLPVSRIEGVEGEIQSPISLVGSTINMLQKAAPNVFNLNVSVQNGAVSILPKNSRLRKEASYISAETGLIGVVSAYNDDTKSNDKSSGQQSKAIRFQCLLDGNILPDESVYVKDGKYDGAYKVTEVNFDGDFEGNSWVCEVIATKTNEVIG